MHEITKKTLISSGFRTLSFHPAGSDFSSAPGVFEAAFIAVSPNRDVIDSFYKSLKSGSIQIPEGFITSNSKNLSRILDPYLNEEAYQVSSNSIFHPVRFTQRFGLVQKFLQIHLPTFVERAKPL